VRQKPVLAASDSGFDLRAQERATIERTLERFHGNRRDTAEALKISAVTLWRKIKQYGLSSTP
jgi:DNA-binding NtrC family response regulator